MNKESLKKLPSLVNAMDENLAININDFINNPVLKELKLHQQKLVEVIKQSHKFHYDNKTCTIKFKEKADRNVLIVTNYILSDDPQERINKEELLKKIVKDGGKNLVSRIKKIEIVGKGIQVIFEHEDFSMEAEKILQNQQSDYEEFKDCQILLAAESLKRRIVSNSDPKFNKIMAQVLFVHTIIINPSIYIPRRFTAGVNKNTVENLIAGRKASTSKSPSKFDEFNKMNTYNVAQIHNYKMLNSLHSQANRHYSNHRSDTLKDIPASNLEAINRYIYTQQNSLNSTVRQSKVLLNKFDLVDPKFFYNALNHIQLSKEDSPTRKKAITVTNKNNPKAKLEKSKSLVNPSHKNKYERKGNSLRFNYTYRDSSSIGQISEFSEKQEEENFDTDSDSGSSEEKEGKNTHIFINRI